MNAEHLHAWFDGELPASEAARLERDLAASPELARRLEEIREVDRALDGLAGHAAAPDFAARVLAAARLDDALDLLPGHAPREDFAARAVEAVRRERRGRLLRVVAPAAAAAAAIVVALLLGRDPGRPAAADAEAAEYRWETDTESFDSLALSDLKEAVLEELDAT